METPKKGKCKLKLEVAFCHFFIELPEHFGFVCMRGLKFVNQDDENVDEKCDVGDDAKQTC